MIAGAVRSELIRFRRRSFRFGWVGITALFSVMVNVFVFSAPATGDESGPQGPGGAFPTEAALAASDGFVAALGTASTFLGVVTLAYWAIAVATDYSTGLIRLLVQAEPRRLRLLAGKAVALGAWTALVTTVATAVSALVAVPMARATGISTAAWSSDVLETLATAWTNTYLALLVWGTFGLVIAVLSRSSAVAIAAGVGYVLIIENMVELVADQLAAWLPGSTLDALASGGTADIPYATAIALGAGYAALGLALAVLVFSRREITD